MIRNLRWYILASFFLAQVISYVDRQALSVNAVEIRGEFGFTNSQYGYLVTAFLIAYTIGPTLTGRLIDRLGVRRGFGLCISWWSVAALLHAFTRGFSSLAGLRFLLGFGESGTLPAVSRTVSEWFPSQERSIAVSIFSAGTAIGAVISIPLIASLTLLFGWRICFIVTGLLGILWLVPWYFLSGIPESHPRIEPAEKALIVKGRVIAPPGARTGLRDLLRIRTVWGIILGRFMVDPVWWFYVFWLPTYLADQRGFGLEQIAWFGWIPFLATDLGSLSGGWVSSRILKRTGNLNRARKPILFAGAVGTLLGLPAAFVSESWLCLVLICGVTFSLGLWAPTVITLCSDVLPSKAVGTMTGLSGTGAGVGGIIFTTLTGWLVDNFSYFPVFVLAGLFPIIGFGLLHFLAGPLRPCELEPSGV